MFTSLLQLTHVLFACVNHLLVIDVSAVDVFVFLLQNFPSMDIHIVLDCAVQLAMSCSISASQ